MSETTEKKKPVCPRCDRGTVYFRTDGSYRCTGCGYDSKNPPKYICGGCIGWDKCKSPVRGGLVTSCKDFNDGVNQG